jgi:hypothetical protein
MTSRPDDKGGRAIRNLIVLAAASCTGGGYTVCRPSRGPSDDKVRMLIDMHQEGEIAFQLHSLAQLQLIAGSVLLESRTYEA